MQTDVLAQQSTPFPEPEAEFIGARHAQSVSQFLLITERKYVVCYQFDYRLVHYNT